MAAPMNHARVCLGFEAGDLESIWFLVKYGEMPLISDVCERINSRYSLCKSKKKRIVMRLQSSILPDWESSELLHDNDRISVSIERFPSGLEESKLISSKKKRQRKETFTDDQGEPVIKKKKRHEDFVSNPAESTRTDEKKIKVITKDTPKFTGELVEDKITSKLRVTNQIASEPVIESDALDADDTASDVGGSLKKRKRIRKHRKKKSDQQNVNGEIEDEKQTKDIKGTKTNIYKGREINKDESFFGSYPDKLISPKFYRHGYRNLNVYQPEPNKHTTFNSDEEEKRTENTEQYNFMSSTKILDEKEAYREAQDKVSSDTDSSLSRKEIKNLCNENTEKTWDQHLSNTEQIPVKDTEKLSFQNIHNTYTSDSSPKSYTADSSVYKDSSVKCNGYQSDTVTSNSHSDFQFKCPSSEPRLVRKATNPSPSQLTRKTLSSGASVYVRQRPGRYQQQQRNGHFEMSKEDQLNTVATNVSIIFNNPEKKENTIPTKETDSENQPRKIIHEDENTKKKNGEVNLPSSTVDFSKLPPLKREPKKGDKIVYKVLEISATCTPEISDYREAIVLGMDKNQMVELKNMCLTEAKKNRFHVEIEDENEVLTNTSHTEELVQLHLSSLLDTRLVQSS